MIDPARGPYGEPFSGDDDTRDLERREAAMLTVDNGYLKNRMWGGGPKGGTVAMALEDEDL